MKMGYRQWCRHGNNSRGQDSLFVFSNDQVILVQDQKDMKYVLRKLGEEYEKVGMKHIHSKKTGYMR